MDNNQPPAQAAENQQGPSILIVEDDVSLAKMYSMKFQTEGFKVLVANDGETGLNMAAQNHPSAILLDMMLPKYSGIEFLEQLNQHSQLKDSVIVCLTNLTEKQEQERAMSLGAKDYLAKAMHTPEEVVEKIKQHLGQGNAQSPAKSEATQA